MELRIIAAIIRAFGKRVPGGYEVFIPREIFSEVYPQSEVSHTNEAGGVRCIFRSNPIIDGGKAVFIEETETPVEFAAAELPALSEEN